jgi:hypothetical protein
MHARHDEVEARQHVVRIIQRSVGQDIGFNAFEDAEATSVSLVQRVRFCMLLGNLVFGLPAGVMC